MLASDFAKRLRTIREQRGLSQRDLAERLHTRAPQVSRYENGSQLPNLETLVALADILHADLGELVLGTKARNGTDDAGVKDVRLLERMRELDGLDKHARETAIAMLEALIVQGHQRSVHERLSGTSRR